MYKVLVLPGDGVGPEVVDEALKVLRKVSSVAHLVFDTEEAVVGGASLERHGVPIIEATLSKAKASDAVLLGAVGGPKWDVLDHPMRPEQALLALREGLGLYANLRPATIDPNLLDASPLKREVVEGVDLLVVRELTGGIYFGKPRGIKKNPDGSEQGFNTEIYATHEVERIARRAFELARKRRRKVVSVDKANILESSILWRKVVTEVGKRFPDVQLSHMYVDNCAMQLIRNPKQFDVMVTTNMFGDILSDEAAMLTGSIGMLPSASIGSGVGAGGPIGLYEPIHGSAPDIAGKDLANPIATIPSAAMMLSYSFNLDQEAAAIERAIVRVLEQGYRTKDIQSPDSPPDRIVGTQEMGRLIRAELGKA